MTVNTLKRMVPIERLEAATAFDGGVTAYVIKYVAEDDGFTFWHIFAAGAPGTSYNDAPLGSEYTDITSYVKYIHTATDTWTKIASNT